jgi:hypothetical protein
LIAAQDGLASASLEYLVRDGVEEVVAEVLK